MITLELNDGEQQHLVKILEYYLSELRMEIADTDRKEFRDNLKIDEAIIKKNPAHFEPSGRELKRLAY